jgi:hypothetical protein
MKCRLQSRWQVPKLVLCNAANKQFEGSRTFVNKGKTLKLSILQRTTRLPSSNRQKAAPFV